MKPSDAPLQNSLLSALDSFRLRLPGIAEDKNKHCFVGQLIESERRIRYIRLLSTLKLTTACADPEHSAFDSLKAAAFQKKQGKFDEACWLVFLFVYFGKSKSHGDYSRALYGGLGNCVWTWQRVVEHPESIQQWLEENMVHLRAAKCRFGNHRKYESLSNTGQAIHTYLQWVGAGGHETRLAAALEEHKGDPRATFNSLYKSLKSVATFGRVAKFDYLCSLGNLGLANVEPPYPYLQGSTGPLAGARLLLGGAKSSKLSCGQLQESLGELGLHLGINMQVMEDALCNWQKSPSRFRAFRG